MQSQNHSFEQAQMPQGAQAPPRAPLPLPQGVPQGAQAPPSQPQAPPSQPQAPQPQPSREDGVTFSHLISLVVKANRTNFSSPDFRDLVNGLPIIDPTDEDILYLHSVLINVAQELGDGLAVFDDVISRLHLPLEPNLHLIHAFESMDPREAFRFIRLCNEEQLVAFMLKVSADDILFVMAMISREQLVNLINDGRLSFHYPGPAARDVIRALPKEHFALIAEKIPIILVDWMLNTMLVRARNQYMRHLSDNVFLRMLFEGYFDNRLEYIFENRPHIISGMSEEHYAALGCRTIANMHVALSPHVPPETILGALCVLERNKPACMNVFFRNLPVNFINSFFHRLTKWQLSMLVLIQDEHVRNAILDAVAPQQLCEMFVSMRGSYYIRLSDQIRTTDFIKLIQAVGQCGIALKVLESIPQRVRDHHFNLIDHNIVTDVILRLDHHIRVGFVATISFEQLCNLYSDVDGEAFFALVDGTRPSTLADLVKMRLPDGQSLVRSRIPRQRFDLFDRLTSSVLSVFMTHGPRDLFQNILAHLSAETCYRLIHQCDYGHLHPFVLNAVPATITDNNGNPMNVIVVMYRYISKGDFYGIMETAVRIKRDAVIFHECLMIMKYEYIRRSLWYTEFTTSGQRGDCFGNRRVLNTKYRNVMAATSDRALQNALVAYNKSILDNPNAKHPKVFFTRCEFSKDVQVSNLSATSPFCVRDCIQSPVRAVFGNTNSLIPNAGRKIVLIVLTDGCESWGRELFLLCDRLTHVAVPTITDMSFVRILIRETNGEFTVNLEGNRFTDEDQMETMTRVMRLIVNNFQPHIIRLRFIRCHFRVKPCLTLDSYLRDVSFVQCCFMCGGLEGTFKLSPDIPVDEYKIAIVGGALVRMADIRACIVGWNQQEPLAGLTFAEVWTPIDNAAIAARSGTTVARNFEFDYGINL